MARQLPPHVQQFEKSHSYTPHDPYPQASQSKTQTFLLETVSEAILSVPAPHPGYARHPKSKADFSSETPSFPPTSRMRVHFSDFLHLSLSHRIGKGIQSHK